ncbi:MAG TPA: HAMP domain-containing sensor histidine kinase [Kofleriaceae bacterium]|nr:HAMP domain-containing sensor histidine kinase [Kofleriaceae bacterium]
MHALLAIRTRWLVASMIIAIAATGVLAYLVEHRRAAAELGDLGREQARIARAAAIALGAHQGDTAALAPLDRADQHVVIVPPGGSPRTLSGAPIVVPELAAALARGAEIVRIERDDASALGLPERTAMIGIARIDDGPARGYAVAIAGTAERQRDRDRAGLVRWILAMAISTGLVTAFGGLALARQRSQLELARELAVAEAARARDAELERLSRAATMAALGSGVAHELSTPLGVIVGRAEQLLARAAGDERLAKAAQTIIDQVDHIDRVMRGLLGLARGAPIALTPCQPGTLVREAADLVEHRFARQGVRLAPVVASDLPEIRCEPLLFKHALVNLLLNACDASPRGGEVRLEVSASGGELTFAVVDEGDGIAPADAARAMEPFFTTKPIGKGTGLGLAIAREIASSHRGTLALAPHEPRGTRASITLPVEGAAA